MAKYSNTIEYNIKTSLDASGLTKLQNQIQQIELTLQKNANRNLLNPTRVEEARNQLQGLSDSLTKAFNPSLGVLDLSKLKTELNNSSVTAQELGRAFKLAGTQGETAFNNMIGQIGKFDSGMRETSSSLDKMFTTFSNTFRWGLISSFFSQFMNAIHQSVDYVKELDDSLTQIMLVTDYNRDAMNQYAKSANEAAKAVSMTTTGMTNASLIFAQQGYDLNQSQALATLSAKVANASQQDTATTSDQITAYMNAYGLEDSIEELTQQMDNWALIANVSAADLGELAQASQRAASMAKTVGVSGEQLAAQIATIESVTREAPEQIGNSLKTLYARFSDISAGGKDEEGVTLGDVTKQLNSIGVQVLDQFGNIRDVGAIMEDLMAIWDDLDQTTKIASAQSLAGKYQVNRFVSLMDNSDMYREYLGATGDAAAGTLDQMNQEYAESLAGRSQKLSTTLEGIFLNLFNTDSLNPLIDLGQKFADVLDNLTEAMGGGIPILTNLVGLFTQVFSKNIAQNITKYNQNKELDRIQEQNALNVDSIIAQYGLQNAPSEASKNIVDFVQKGAANRSTMSEEQVKQYNEILQELVQSSNSAAEAQENLNKKIKETAAAVGIGTNDTKALFTDESTGMVNTSYLVDLLAEKSADGDLRNINKEEFREAASSAEELAGAILRVDHEFINLTRETDNNKRNFDSYNGAIDSAANRLKELYAQGGLSEENYKRLSEKIENLRWVTADWDQENQRAADSITELGVEALDLTEIIQGLLNGDIKWDSLDAGIQEAVLQVVRTKGLIEQTGQISSSFMEKMDTQKLTQSITETVGAVTQLASVWMSVQNLGSIFHNKDLSNGEKFLQIVMNLGMALTQTINVFKQFGSASEKLNKYLESMKQSQEGLANSTKKDTEAKAANTMATKANEAAKKGTVTAVNAEAAAQKQDIVITNEDTESKIVNTGATTGLGIASKIATPLVTGLSKALAFLSGPWGIAIMATVAAVSALNGVLEAQRKEQEAALQERLDASNEQASSLKENAKSIQSLYEQYQQTGEASDELKDKLAEQAEALGVVTKATDTYESLKNKIDEATASQLQYNAALRAQGEDLESTPKEMTAYEAGLSAHTMQAIGAQPSSLKTIYNYKTGQYENVEVEQGANLAESVEKARELIQSEQEAIQLNEVEMMQLNRANDAENERYELLKAENEQRQTWVDEYSKYVQGNEPHLADQYDQAESRVLSHAMKSNSVFANTTNDAGESIATTYEQALGYVRDLTNGLTLTDAEQKQLAADALEYAGNLDAAAEAHWAQVQATVNGHTPQGDSDIVKVGTNDLYKRSGQYGIDLINNFAKENKLSTDDKVKISSMIEWEDEDVDNKVALLLNTLNEKMKDGLSLENALKTQINPEDAMKSFSEMKPIDADVSEESFQNLGKYIAENADQLEGFSGDLGQNIDLLDKDAELLAEVTEEILRYQNAVDEASEKMDSWMEALDSDDLKKRSTAISEIDNAMEDLLGLDTGSLSTAFAADPSNLRLLQEAIDGTASAYDELYEKALEDIIIGVDVDNQRLNSAFDRVWGMINDVEGIYATATIGAELDNEAFIAALDEMVNAAGWSADEAQEKLLAMGVDADVTEITEDLPETQEAIGYKPVQTDGITLTYPKIVSGFNGGTSKNDYGPLQVIEGGQTAHLPGFTMEPVYSTATGGKQATAAAVKMTAANGQSIGGNLKVSNAHKVAPTGGTLSGTTKRANSGGGGSSGGGGGGGGGGSSCFVAGTLIATFGGFKPIEEIQKGNLVLSFNEMTGVNEYSEVVQTMIHDTTEPIYTLYIKSEQLQVTGIHRFLITPSFIHKTPQWVSAENLIEGDWVLFADGSWHLIHKIEVKVKHQKVYNFEVLQNHNYYVGHNQILAHNKGGSGSGGSGGSGGSSGKTYEAKTKESVKKDIDLYEKVNTQLEDVESTLENIEKEEDRLVGDKARTNMNKQITLLNKEIDLQKEKLAIQKKEQSDLANELKGYGYQFDSDGFITNYNDTIKNYENRINDLINQYNNTTTEEGQKSLDDQIKKLEKEYDAARKAADRYDKLQGKEIQDTLNTIEELRDSIEDLRIEAWKASTEAIDNLKDIREAAAELEGFFSKYETDSPFRDLIEEGERLNNIWSVGKDQARKYYDEIINDKKKALSKAVDKDERATIQMSIDYFKSLRDSLSNEGLNNGLLGLAYQDMLQLKAWFENPNAKDNIFMENTAALKEAYEEAYNKVHDMLLDYEKEVEDYRDSIIDAYDEIEDKQEEQIDKFDKVVDRLETFADMYSLYYGDETYGMMRDVLQQEGNTLREQLNQQKEIYAYWANEYAKAIQTGDEKLLKELEEKMNDANDKVVELAEAAAEKFADSYTSAVKASTQYIIQNTIGDKNFNRLDRNWEWDKDYLDKYRDDVEKAYEMDKLRNKYTNLLNQAQGASLQTQNKIRAQMQEQLDLLDGQATVSEYDVKLANSKLEILQKQIALEDAQRNKNKMQLRRDTQGNYRYVYTSNQEDVEAAQQELLDSEYDAYELSKNQQVSNYDNLINAYQRYLSQREEILNNANLSEQEKLEQNAELYDKFLKFVDAAKEDFSDAAFGTLDILNWLTLNGTDYTTTAAVDMLNNLLDEQGHIKDETGVIWMDNANFITQEVLPKINSAVAEADNDIKKRMSELKNNMVGDNGVLPAISQGISGPDGVVHALENAKYSTDALTVSTRDLMEALNGDNGALADAQKQLQKYLDELNNVKNASSVTARQLRETQKQLDTANAQNLNYKTQLDDLKSGKSVISNGQIVGPGSGKDKKNGDWTGFTGYYYHDSWGSTPSGDWYSGKANAVRISTFSRQSGYGPYNVHLETADGGWLGWVKEDQLFDTGGYTGKWANGEKRENGKLAFLHQKELVLNEDDTKNILSAVNLVRQIGVGLRNNIANVDSVGGHHLNTRGETIKQRVEITATFPNATDANDIRQAIVGLADKAYQYTHRDR